MFMKRKTILVNVFVFVVILILSSFVFSFDDENEEPHILNSVESDLLIAYEDLNLLKQNSIPYRRYYDLLISTNQLFDAQKALEEKEGNADYDLVIQRLQELNNLKILAMQAYDELNALKLVVNSSDYLLEDDLLNDYYLVAINECDSERFELCISEIDKVYVRMSNMEATETKLRTAYDAATRNVKTFLYSARYYFLAFFTISILIFFVSRKQFLIFKTKKQIKDLGFKKKVIENLIANTQRLYFERNELNESTYHIRIKKYSELIRDINRQVPLLEEKLGLLSKNKFKKNSKR